MSTHTLVHRSDGRRWRRSLGEIEVSGFNLFELLVVLCVLGLLAAITIFALGGVASAGSIATCSSDSRAINQAAQALIIENPGSPPTTPAAWQLALLGKTQAGVWTTVASGAPFLESWPNSSGYSISIAGYGAVPTTGDSPAINPANGDVIVSHFAPSTGTRTFDSTASPLAACGSSS